MEWKRREFLKFMCRAKKNRIGKKGQAEDIFSDLLVAAILIAVTLVIISINEGMQSGSRMQISDADSRSLDEISLINMLRIQMQVNQESEAGSSIKFMSIAEIIGLASENYDQNPEAEWLFRDNDVLEGNPGKIAYCSGELEKALRDITLRSRIEAVNDENRIVFRCGETTPQYGESAAPLTTRQQKIIIPEKSGKLLSIYMEEEI